MSQQVITAREIYPSGGADLIQDGAVLIDGTTITAIGSRADIEARTDDWAVRSDHPGTLLPGLVDSHVHLAFAPDEHAAEVLQTLGDDELLSRMAERAESALRAGTTTLRDLGDRGGLAAQLRNEIARDERDGPRILTAGAPLTPPGGHCWFLGGEVSGPDGLRDQITFLAEQGVDLIKIMVSGGFITADTVKPWELQFSVDDLRLVVKTASEHGLPVAAHAHGTGAIDIAAEAGVATIEHCAWMRLGDNAELEDRLDIPQRMADQGIYACPAWPADWRALLASLGDEVGERAIEKMVRMRDLGVQLIAGTDAGVIRSEHGGLTAGLEFYRQLGMTPAEIIDMATTDSATALGIGDRTGRLAPGYDADLLGVAGSPLEDITALQSPRFVMARGAPVTP